MIHKFVHRLSRFRQDESGHASIEFAIMFPILFYMLLSAIELGIMNLRDSMLERSLDIAVREVRITTGFQPSHQELKEMICSETGMIPDCLNNLLLEMVQKDPRNWTDLSSSTNCTNRAEETHPVTTFTPGQDNELMILRACAKYEPMFNNYGLAGLLTKDSSGDISLIAISAFVQEPK